MFSMMGTHNVVGLPLKSLLVSLMLFTVLQDVAGFDCDIVPKEKGFLDAIVNPISAKSCPRTMIDSSDQVFCCQTEEIAGTSLNYCCDIQNFIKMTWVIYTLVGIGLGILLTCCLCGCCCYRRRSGAVYGRVQTVVMQQPGAVHIPQASQYPVQQYAVHGHHQAPPPYNAATSQVYTQVAPPYSATTTEVYAKQAPYNPHAY